MDKGKWVQNWGQSHSALSFFCYPSARRTFRLIINSAISGDKMRISLSNRFGKNDVSIGSITVGKCDENGNVNTGLFKRVSFDGETSITLKKGERIRSDEFDFDINTNEYYCVNAYVTGGDLTSGNLLDNAKITFGNGNYSQTAYMKDEYRKRDSVIKFAGKLLGMHFPRPIPLFDSVEVLNYENADSIVVFGDSISQQGFWTIPFEERLRERYPGQYSLVNKSVMGNRLLRDCSPIFPAKGLYGIKATDRINDDIYPYDNIKYVILFLGVNDIFEYGTINALKSEKPDPEDIFAAIKSITDSLHSRGTKVVMFNIPAFGSAPDATREKDAMRKVVNAMLKDNCEMFDGFFDIASAAEDPEDDYYSKAEFIGPDKLHPNAYGGKYLADLIDLDMFK
ncbi:MAG: hypothetical protein K6F64_09960 [Clostridia bacterium]|nr:hypothetical protein [Clostridia bacterium]